MNLDAALTDLAEAGVTADALAAEHVDPADPAAVRRLVEELLGAALAEDCILTSRGQIRALQRALGELRTDAELAEDGALVRRIIASMRAAQAHRPIPTPSRAFQTCLDAA